MATQLLATGSTAADSTELTVSAGTPVTVSIKGDTSPVEVQIKLKDDASGFRVVGMLTSDRPALCISAPGVYKFTRQLGQTCGVFSA
jgi:hypothetical protein